MASIHKWKRLGCGYVSRDGEWLLERGALMSDGNTNAWLISRRAPEARIGRDTRTAYDQKTGNPLWRLTEDGYTDTAEADYTGDLYAHDWDAGSLAEAKHTVTIIEGEAA